MSDRAKSMAARRRRVRFAVRFLTVGGFALVGAAILVGMMEWGSVALVATLAILGCACHALAIYLVPKGAEPDD